MIKRIVMLCPHCKNNTFEVVYNELQDNVIRIDLYCTSCKQRTEFKDKEKAQ